MSEFKLINDPDIPDPAYICIGDDTWLAISWEEYARLIRIRSKEGL